MLSFKEFLMETDLLYSSLGYNAGDWTWVWYNNELLYEQNSHHGLEPNWKHILHEEMEWRGRFDKNKKIATFLPPGTLMGNKNVPREIKEALKKQFGRNILFKGFYGAKP